VAPEQGYGLVPDSGRASGNFLLGAGLVQDNGPVAGNARVPGNFLLVADPVQDNGPAVVAGRSQDNGHRAAGTGQRSGLPTGEPD
jgi:hypothetical protein